MVFDDNILKTEEKIMFALRSLYHQSGYVPFKMSRFEEYDLYAKNKDFLVSSDILTFTDLNGKLLALKPDVTLSIIKNYKGNESGLYKVYYNENVYRPEKGMHEFEEIMQSGIECIGDVDICAECEVIALAVKSLSVISDKFILDIASAGMVNGLLNAAVTDGDVKRRMNVLMNAKNIHGLREVCSENSVGGGITDALIRLSEINLKASDDFSCLERLCINREMSEAYERLVSVVSILKKCGLAENIRIDFSIISDANYYSGIVFRGYVDELPKGVLSGGRYDKLLSRMGKKGGAIGFAVYSGMLERLRPSSRELDSDAVIIYDDTTLPEKVLMRARSLREEGKTVNVLKKLPANYRSGEIIDMTKEGK